MITALLTFLGSAGLRVFVGQLFDLITKGQDQRQEIERMRVQGELDAAQHERNLAAIKLQADLGIKTIEVQGQAVADKLDAEAVLETIRGMSHPTGIALVDAWNGIIRPLLASIAIGLWIASLWMRHWVLDDWDRALMSAVLGLFVGGRIHVTGR